MRVVPILVVLCVLLSAKWAIFVSFASLKEQCKERSGLDLVVKWIKAVIGLPDPEPPWWRPAVCKWVNREPQGYVEAFVIVTALLLLYSMCWRRKKKTRHRQGRKLCNRKLSLGPQKCRDAQAKRCMDLLPTKRKFDGSINIEHSIPRGQSRYQQLVLGPVSVTFQAIQAVIVTYFKALGLSEKDLKFTSKIRDNGTPEFLGICSKNIWSAVVLIPDEGINVQVQRVAPARGLIRKMAYQTYHVTNRGFVLRDEGTSLLYGSG